MKATLTFNLDNPDDKVAHLRAIKSLDMASMIFELLRNTKKSMQYKIDASNLDGHETLDAVYDRIQELMDNNNLDADELIN